MDKITCTYVLFVIKKGPLHHSELHSLTQEHICQISLKMTDTDSEEQISHALSDGHRKAVSLCLRWGIKRMTRLLTGLDLCLPLGRKTNRPFWEPLFILTEIITKVHLK